MTEVINEDLRKLTITRRRGNLNFCTDANFYQGSNVTE
jgi:hypothetical protein